MKRKERAKGKSKDLETTQDGAAFSERGATDESPIKKRRVVNGSEMVFRLPGDESDEEERGESTEEVRVRENAEEVSQPQDTAIPAAQPNITIYDSDT
jgi:PRKR-interacting protein 1